MSDKVALVTGSSRGIGRAIALKLAREGYALVVNGATDSANLASVKAAIEESGRPCAAIAGDVGDLEVQARLIEAAQELGELACLVNNAGVSVLSRGDLLEVGAESYDRCQHVNARGVFFLTQAAARVMAAASRPDHHRSIVVISSINAIAATITRGEYCISKAAASMLTRLFALRLAELGVGVYEIQPGLIKTDMTAPAQEKYDQMIGEGKLPIPRWGQPEDVARLTAAMARGDMAYAVGQAIQLDGGLSVTRF